MNRDFERKRIVGTEEYVNQQVKKLEREGYKLNSRKRIPSGKRGEIKHVADMIKPKLERRI